MKTRHQYIVNRIQLDRDFCCRKTKNSSHEFVHFFVVNYAHNYNCLHISLEQLINSSFGCFSHFILVTFHFLRWLVN